MYVAIFPRERKSSDPDDGQKPTADSRWENVYPASVIWSHACAKREPLKEIQSAVRQ